MAMVKIAILLLVVFSAAAFGNSHEVDSIHEHHPNPSDAPSPSKDAGEDHKAAVVCALGCVAKCQDKKSWRQAVCVGLCLAQCTIDPSDSTSEIACVVECAQSSTNNLRYEAKISDRIGACAQQCKKN